MTYVQVVIKADEEQREIAPAGSDEGDVKAADWLQVSIIYQAQADKLLETCLLVPDK